MIEFRAEQTADHYDAKVDEHACLVPECDGRFHFCSRHWKSIAPGTVEHLKRTWRTGDFEEMMIALTYAIDDCINLDTV